MTTPTPQSSSVLNYQSPSKEGSPLRWLGWAIYLGMSWTWCIGMFLPVLLVREYGIWGWVVFALPNVIGAAAMGWVIKSRDMSLQMVESHRSAMILFSGVTAAFQVFFGFWFFQRLGLNTHGFPLVMLAAAILAVGIPTAVIPRAGVWLAVLILLLSGLCFAEVLPRAQPANLMRLFNSSQRLEIAPLGLSCVFGFLCCPYLDLTFHRARQDLGRTEARLAFGIGFGVVFWGMIFATLLYSIPLIIQMVDPDFNLQGWLWWLGIYFLIQLAFTIGIHWTAEAPYRTRRDRNRYLYLMFISGMAGLGCWILTQWIRHPSMESGELIYRLFLGFYGLVFPAYVWLCMIPGRGIQPPTKRQLTACAIAIMIAAPMFWLGFIDQKMFWLLPGLAVVLLARIFLKPFRVQSV